MHSRQHIWRGEPKGCNVIGWSSQKEKTRDLKGKHHDAVQFTRKLMSLVTQPPCLVFLCFWFSLSPVTQALDQIVRANVHRLVIVSKEGQLVGILSLSDILRFLIDA